LRKAYNQSKQKGKRKKEKIEKQKGKKKGTSMPPFAKHPQKEETHAQKAVGSRKTLFSTPTSSGYFLPLRQKKAIKGRYRLEVGISPTKTPSTPKQMESLGPSTPQPSSGPGGMGLPNYPDDVVS
jgi:hypothetical protein